MNALALARAHTRIVLRTRTQGTMKFRTEATPLARLRLIAFRLVGLTAVHAAFPLYRLVRSEEVPPVRCGDFGDRGRGACA